MNGLEALKIIQLRNIAYQRANTNQGKDALEEEVKLYADIFKSDKYTDVEKALKKHMVRSPYPPTISDLINELAWNKNIKPIDAWKTVVRVIGMYGTSQPDKALAELSGTILEAVKRIGFTKLCRMNEVEAKDTFIEVYKDIVIGNQGGVAC